MAENPYQSPEAESRSSRRRPGLISKSTKAGICVAVVGVASYLSGRQNRTAGTLLFEIGVALLIATLVAWLVMKLR